MSTLASLAGMLGQVQNIRPWDIATRSQTQADTGLLELADLKAKQQAEQLMLERIKNDPALAQQLFGGSTLGALGPAGGTGAPGGPQPGAITQSPLGGGPAQQIPAYPDASQFATQGAPDQRPRGFAPEGAQPQQSILASLGPAGQPQMQAPQRNPVLEMAQRDPRAAMMLSQQMEQRQDQQMKRQEQNMKLGAATLGYVGQQAQGVTDQASLDALRSDLQSQGLGKYAAQLPQLYSKGAMEPFITKALDVKEALTLQVQDLTAQAAVIRARKEGRSVDVDNQLRAMGVQPGQETPGQIRAALDAIQQGKVDVSAAQGRGAAEIERTEKPLEGVAGKAVSDLTLLRKMTDDVNALRKDAYTGPLVGRSGYLREQGGFMDPEETAFRSTLKNVNDILGRLRSGANIPAPEMANLERLAPNANDPPETFKAKMQSFQRALEQQRESVLRVGTTGREQLRGETTPTTPRVGEKPTSQGSAGSGKPVSQMSLEETDAEIAAIKARGGR